MKKIIIAAVAANGVIGKEGKLPWKIPEEMKWFKEQTINNVVIMGLNTFDSLNSLLLPSRFNIILSRKIYCNAFVRNKDGSLYGASNSLQEAFDLAERASVLHSGVSAENAQCFIIGGASLFAQAIPICDEMLISRIRNEYEGDTRFPDFDESQFTKEIIKEEKDFYVERYTRRTT
jgi:dihydrofolate reductase